MAFLILPYSCERDEQIAISTKAKFNAPSITQAKQHLEQHTTLNLKDPNNFFQSRNLEGSLTVDWELSGIKKYKDEPEQQVDILYTPIYINNDAQAKMFVGSVEYNGEIKSNVFCLIYTDLENTTTFSGYFLRFDLDGILISASKYNNGMIVQPENDNNGALGRSNNSECTDFATLMQCLQDYFRGDLDMSFWHLGGILDTVVVTATSIDAEDSMSGGNPFDTALPPSIYIPPADIDNNNTGGGIGLPFWSLNYVTANGFNISQWLQIHPLTPIAQWLINEANTNQLQQIANFLNDHRFKIRDEYPLLNVDGSDGFEPADSPTASTGYAISEFAKGFALLAIEALKRGSQVNFEELYIEELTPDDNYIYDGPKELIPNPLVLDNGDLINITFGVTNSDNQSADQEVATLLIEGLKFALNSANNNLPTEEKITTIHIFATTNGEHGSPNSNHYKGTAVDISRINGVKMAVSGLTQQIIELQEAMDNFPNIRENFGPHFKHKYSVETGTWNFNHNVGGHQDHIHFSVR